MKECMAVVEMANQPAESYDAFGRHVPSLLSASLTRHKISDHRSHLWLSRACVEWELGHDAAIPPRNDFKTLSHCAAFCAAHPSATANTGNTLA